MPADIDPAWETDLVARQTSRPRFHHHHAYSTRAAGAPGTVAGPAPGGTSRDHMHNVAAGIGCGSVVVDGAWSARSAFMLLPPTILCRPARRSWRGAAAMPELVCLPGRSPPSPFHIGPGKREGGGRREEDAVSVWRQLRSTVAGRRPIHRQKGEGRRQRQREREREREREEPDQGVEATSGPVVCWSCWCETAVMRWCIVQTGSFGSLASPCCCWSVLWSVVDGRWSGLRCATGVKPSSLS